MNILLNCILKTIMHIAIITIFFYSKIRTKLYIVSSVLLVLVNFLPASLHIKKYREYRKTYSRKRYHMPTLIYAFFNTMEYILMLLLVISIHNADQLNLDKGILCFVHFLFVTIVNFNRSRPTVFEKKNVKWSLDSRIVKGSIVENGECVLKKGEVVLYLDSHDGIVSVRKSNGMEYNVSANMVAKVDRFDDSS